MKLVLFGILVFAAGAFTVIAVSFRALEESSSARDNELFAVMAVLSAILVFLVFP